MDHAAVIHAKSFEEPLGSAGPLRPPGRLPSGWIHPPMLLAANAFDIPPLPASVSPKE